jgi:VWFA-related protein
VPAQLPVLRLAFLPLLCLVLASPPAAAQGAGAGPPPESFAEETAVVVVEVPVEVVRDGDPVRGLTAEDFEVHDGRTPRPISSFEVVDLAVSAAAPGGGAAAPAAAPSPAGRRHFLFFFDLYFTSVRSLDAAERAARKIVESGLHPTDLVGVGFFSDARGVVVPLRFTADRAQALAALDAFRALLDRDQESAAERLGMSGKDLAAIVGRIGRGVPEKTNLAMDLLMDEYFDENLPHMMTEMARANRESGRGEIEMLAAGLTALARAHAGIEGRKHLLFFSDGFNDSFLRGERTMRNRGRPAGGDAGIADAMAYADLDRMAQEFRRGGWVIDTVEAFGLSGNWDPTGFSSEGMSYIARQSGGTFFTQTNDLSAAMARVLEASSVVYVLTFHVPDAKFDGKYHPIEVKLRGGPAGARAVHRAGYYAPRRAEEGRQTRRAKAIDLLLGPERSDLRATALVAPFRAAHREGGGGAYVPVIVEVDPESLAPDVRGVATTVEFYGYAFDGGGMVGDFFTQVVRFETARWAETVRAGGLRFVADLELAPGKYDLRLLVRSAASGRAAVQVVPLEVPDFARAGASLLPPFFVQPERAGLTVREMGSESDEAVRAYPFVAGGQAFVPSARPVVQAGEEVRLFLAGHNLANGNVELEGRVLGRDGKPVGGVGVMVTAVGRDRNAAGQDHLLATLDAGRLKPGDYTLEVSVFEPDPLGLSIALSEADRGRAITSQTPFRVAGKR